MNDGPLVGILHNGTDWACQEFVDAFGRKGIDAGLFSVANIEVPDDALADPEYPKIPHMQDFVDQGYTSWMVRVYPSDADLKNIQRTLQLIQWLTIKRHFTVNPITASSADYDKLASYKLLATNGVQTPKTLDVPTDLDVALVAAERLGFPAILKRRTGGKGHGVVRLKSRDHAAEEIRAMLNGDNDYAGQYVLQEFCGPAEGIDYDVRIGVIGDTPCISYKRTLVAPAGDSDRWMACCAKGSDILPYDHPKPEEQQIAVDATKAINALVNECDITITERGPVVIECNPTPGYDPGEERWIKLIVDKFITAAQDSHIEQYHQGSLLH